MNKFQRVAIRTIANGEYRHLADIQDETVLAAEVEKIDDLLFHDALAALATVETNQEAITALRSAVENHHRMMDHMVAPEMHAPAFAA